MLRSMIQEIAVLKQLQSAADDGFWRALKDGSSSPFFNGATETIFPHVGTSSRIVMGTEYRDASLATSAVWTTSYN